ncbi:MAG: hypothetical protein JRJ04_03885 [Deltaproteobacteria bacterium]|nr:hypothetical protein [Deltaproteobacteria bacterium]
MYSSNNYVGIIDKEDRRLYGRRHPNRLPEVLMAFEPYRNSLEAVAVESTYNWYWLVDGL